MNKCVKKILSFVLAICLVLSGLILPGHILKAEAAASKYVKTDFGAGKLLITTVYNSTKYYLPATTTGSSPVAKSFTDVSEIPEEHLWTVEYVSADQYYIKNSDGKYLYTTNNNNGVKVGTTQGTWAYNSEDNFFKFTNTNRYLGIYNNQDWRSYTTYNAANYSGSSQAFVFYKIDESVPSVDTSSLNAVDSYMSLGYKYDVVSKDVPTKVLSTDTLDISATGIEAGTSSYANWAITDNSFSASYAGQSAGGYEDDGGSIQIRSKNNNSGIVTTASKGNAVKIVIDWNNHTLTGRELQIYGKNTAYTTPSDLYGTDSGTLLGTIKYGTSEFVIDGAYKHIGIKSADGAIYLTSIKITWSVDGDGSTTVKEDVYENSDFAIRCAVDTTISSTGIENIEECGIQISAGGKTVSYTVDELMLDDDNNKLYVIIGLGDIIQNFNRLDTDFNVTAYIVVDGTEYTSTSVKTYSVVSMVKEYMKNGQPVENLYNYLVENGLIVAEENN